MNALPNFLCVGAQKAGTTTLYEILKQHPEIYVPTHKEAHFFDQEDRYEKGIEWWVNTFLSDYDQQPMKGVFTPEYMYYPEVLPRIVKDLGKDLKIIIMLRNPINRAFSSYMMAKRSGFETLSFEEAIAAEPERLKNSAFERYNFSYIDRGRYTQQIQRIFEHFNRDQVMIISFEKEIKQNLDTTIQRVEEFLGVAPLPLKTVHSNYATETKSKTVQKIVRGDNLLKRMIKPLFSASARRKIKTTLFRMNQRKVESTQALSPAEKEAIFERFYSKEIEGLKQLTGMDFSYWLDEFKSIE